jgi:FAD/FMN-containing dehydrogenase
MHKILTIDTIGMTISAEAGAVLENLALKAEEKGLLYPIDLAAKGSCQLGGTIATNAGGLTFIRYQGTRQNVLGLEVVLADGTVLNLNRELYKNNTGYDLAQWFIGSEGTLGVITKATMRLVTRPKNLVTSTLAVGDAQSMLAILAKAHQWGYPIHAFEFYCQKSLELVLKTHPQTPRPFTETSSYYLLVTWECSDHTLVQGFLTDCLELGLIIDAVVADSHQTAANLWSIRENISESLSKHRIHKNDISLPVRQLAHFLDNLDHSSQALSIFAFGHLGDGNIHLNYLATGDEESFQQALTKIETSVSNYLQRYRGSISAEHGIGLLKKHHLKFARSPLEIQLMLNLKKQLDPSGILNPGKIFSSN